MADYSEDILNVPLVDFDYDDPGRIFTRMLEEIQRDENIDLLAFTFPVEEEEDTYLTLMLSDGRADWRRRRFEDTGAEPDIAVITSGAPLMTGDFSGDGPLRWNRINSWLEGAASAICVPLRHEGRVFGAATALWKNAPASLKTDDIEKLDEALKPYSVSIYVTESMSTWIKKISHLNSLIHVSTLINSSLDLDQILEYALVTASSISNAEASSLLLVDEKSQRGHFKAAIGEKAERLKDFQLEPGEGIAGWVAKHGQPLNVPDVNSDPRFSGRIARAVDFPVRNALCVPLKVKKKIHGSLEVLNKKDEDSFDWMDMTSLIAIANQAAIAIENSRLYMDAITDQLTGVYSRRFYQTQLEKEMRKAARKQTPLSLVMFDIDNFKIFNDTYGHETGDVVLRIVAGTLKDNLRGSDTAARYGGEEFVAILPETTSADASMIAERIRAKLAETPIQYDGQELFVTISGGVATYPESTQNENHLFYEADHAMYMAKQAGKNTVRVAGDNN